MRYTNQSVRYLEYFSSAMPLKLRRKIIEIIILLESIPIFTSNNQRMSGPDVMINADRLIKENLKSNKVFGLRAKVYFDTAVKHAIKKINSSDKVDILIIFSLHKSSYTFAVEFDAARADQVAKKFVSRSALLCEQNLFYVAYCYSGTNAMDHSEVLKYFSYIESTSRKLNLKGFVGIAPSRVVEKKNKTLQKVRLGLQFRRTFSKCAVASPKASARYNQNVRP